MIRGKVNVLLDAQWGSSGKGKFAAWLADQCEVSLASSSNMPNAGHSVVRDGVRRVYKCLPAASLSRSVGTALLTGASVIDLEQLDREVYWTDAEVCIHERAVILEPRHREAEQTNPGLVAIASTQQGSAAATIEKLLRHPDVIARAKRRIREYANVLSSRAYKERIWDELLSGGIVLHEVSQGYALSLDHGSHYPHCTSRNCTTARALDDLGLPPQMLGDVYLNVRPYPIRVGNIVQDGQTVGYSGDVYEDCEETDWATIGRDAGMPDDEIQRLYQAELTTVTKRLRRVFTFSGIGFVDAARANGATKIILNFAQYIDWQIHRARGRMPIGDLPARVRDFVRTLEALSGCPVVAIGTGPDHQDVITVRGL
jgi:adenylosuccinate synthase